VALLYVTLVRIPLGTVALEETLFRGVLLGLGRRCWRPGPAVAWSSLLFGLWHVLPARGLPGFSPVVAGAAHGTPRHLLAITLGVAGTALAGVLLCWLRLRARSLLAPVMVHLATNSLAYATAWAILRAG
jgi:membrane protease YdiL (CAAX protease family)